eukprot:m.42524 g.42524  ORF g.42524 m.42524 type:complete len:195 (-) comp12109_c0_seq1:58-642(-)
MALVTVTDVQVLNNPAPFTSPFEFEVTFECVGNLNSDIEWKIIYVGSAKSEECDQTLDSVLVGPVPLGLNKFVFQADAPDPSKIPASELIGVTVVLLTCSYRDQEFVRVGYYVNNDYVDPELRENPPATVDISLLGRNILASKPRVTRFPIRWDDYEEANSDMAMQLQEQQAQREEMAQGIQQMSAELDLRMGQ